MKLLNTRYDAEASVAEMRPHPENPRQGDVGGIYTSIAANGFYGAVIVHEVTGHILAGSHRFRAALEAGAETIPAIYVDCDEVTAKKIMVADNRLSDLAANDDAALAAILRAIALEDTLEGTGFDGDDLDDLLAAPGAIGIEPGGTDSPGPAASSSSPGPTQYGVVVVCDSEPDQQSVYNRLIAEGFTCRILTTTGK